MKYSKVYTPVQWNKKSVVQVNSNNMSKIYPLVHLYSEKRKCEKKRAFFSSPLFWGVQVVQVIRIHARKGVIQNAE